MDFGSFSSTEGLSAELEEGCMLVELGLVSPFDGNVDSARVVVVDCPLAALLDGEVVGV